MSMPDAVSAYRNVDPADIAKPSIYWIDQFAGINQRMNMDKIATNASPMMCNISMGSIGSWVKRLGSSLLGTTQAGTGVWGIQNYKQSDGTDILRAIRSTDIDDYDEITTHDWTQIASGAVTATTATSTKQFIDRVYYANGSDYLKYNTTGATTDVSSTRTATASTSSTASTLITTSNMFVSTDVGKTVTNTTDSQTRTITAYTSATQVTVNTAINDTWDNDKLTIVEKIKGKHLTVSQNTLFLSNITYLGQTAVTDADRTYYSVFDSTNNTPSHQLYNTTEGTETGTLGNSTRWFRLQLPIVGSFSFGVTGLSYFFTADACYSFDMSLENNATGPKKVFDIGLANENAIDEVNGWMIWIDRSGRIWAWGGAGSPVNVSYDIEDENLGNAIISKIDKSGYADWALGGQNNQFWVSIGNITVYDKTINNCVLVALFNSDMSTIVWGAEGYPVQFRQFTKTTLSDKVRLVAACKGVDDVYILQDGANDGNTAIDAYVRTAFLDLALPLYKKEYLTLFIKYRPQSTSSTYLTVKYAIDGNLSYTTIASNSTSLKHGRINMYSATSSVDTDNIAMIAFPTGVKGRTLSLELSNSTAGQSFEIKGIGIMFKKEPLNIVFNA